MMKFHLFYQFLTSAVMYVPELHRRHFSLPKIPRLYMISYAVPAVLYTINNNIGLFMQLHMDPTTYQVSQVIVVVVVVVVAREIKVQKILKAKILMLLPE